MSVHPAAPPTTTPSWCATAVPRVQALLAAHVPLSLLLDLADPGGPHSADLLREERACADRARRG